MLRILLFSPVEQRTFYVKPTYSSLIPFNFFAIYSIYTPKARRCPGSRVAVNETQLILSQLILDWKISAPEEVKSYKDVEYTQKTLLVAHLPEMKIEARA